MREMPLYDYFCDENQTTVAVRHGMSEDLKTWGELCERAGHPSGDTQVEAPVRRLLAGGMVLVEKRTAGGGHGGCCGESGCSSSHG